MFVGFATLELHMFSTTLIIRLSDLQITFGYQTRYLKHILIKVVVFFFKDAFSNPNIKLDKYERNKFVTCFQ